MSESVQPGPVDLKPQALINSGRITAADIMERARQLSQRRRELEMLKAGLFDHE